MTDSNLKHVEQLLKQAATLNPASVEKFYQALFTAEFLVPTREGSIVESTDPQTGATEARIIPARNPAKEGIAIIGRDGTEAHDFATVALEGRRYLPFFASEENLHAWLGPAAPFRKVSLEKILYSVKGETWLYLEPNQEYGKEFSPWEIEQLRLGPGAIEDLVADQLEDTPREIGISQDTSLYPEFRSRLRTMLDVFEEIEEAFLLIAAEEGAGQGNVLLGIRQTNLDPEKQKYLSQEIDFARASALPAGVSAAVLFDLSDPKSPNSKLFRGAVPFYIAQRKVEGTVGKIGAAVSGLLRRKNTAKDKK